MKENRVLLDPLELREQPPSGRKVRKVYRARRVLKGRKVYRARRVLKGRQVYRAHRVLKVRKVYRAHRVLKDRHLAPQLESSVRSASRRRHLLRTTIRCSTLVLLMQ
jgi:hypothetical protein